MRDGSFEKEFEGIDFDDEFEMRPISLAEEIPSPIGPDNRRHREPASSSSAVESLIGQNDDLMSRLSVALRKVAELEERFQGQTLENQSYRTRYENLQDQVLVLKEKIKILSDRKKIEDSEIQSYKDQIQLVEIRYAELYESAQKKETKYRLDLATQQRALHRLERYRNRIKATISSFKSTVRSNLKEHESLVKRVSHQEMTISDLRKNILESSNYIRSLSEEKSQEMAALTEQFESSLKQKEDLIQKLMAENQELDHNKQDLTKAQNEIIDLNNQLIARDRRYEEYQMDTSSQIADLQKTVTRYKHESNDFALELEDTKDELKTTNEVLGEAREENFRLNEQVENLQSLWKDQQRKIEKVQAKNTSLQKLNQELSIAINQYRKDIRDLRAEIDNNYLSTKDKTNKSKTPKVTKGATWSILEVSPKPEST